MRFWLRWSWRDLRERWLLVVTIALTIALGTGTYAGLGSTSVWRRDANDANFALLRMHDLRVRPLAGALVPQGSLAELVGEIEHAAWIETAEERLVVPTGVDASGDGRTILVPGRIVGVPVGEGRPAVDALHVRAGRALEAADAEAATPVALLEYHFAAHYGLPEAGRVHLSGHVAVDYVGQALTPEYFLVTTERGGLMAEANFAALFVPLATAQALSGRAGQVNDLVLALRPGADVELVAGEIERLLADRAPRLGATVFRRDDDEAYHVLYQDIENDQQFWSLFAALILAGATFAAFNLTSRIVEAQRRQVGIAMALGVPGRLISVRPLLVGAQIALLGVVFGVGVGLVIGEAMRGLLEDLVPLPVWSAPFQARVFAEGAALGFFLPFAATAYPVWRALRVRPIEAIRTGYLAARGGGWASVARRWRLPGGTFGRMPFRNVLRTPRRTLLTALGIAAAATVLVATSGMLDTFMTTIDRGEAEVLRGSPDRLGVDLDGFQPAEEVAARIEATGAVARVEPALRVAATLLAPEAASGGTLDELAASIEMLDLASGSWRPTLTAGEMPGPSGGIVIAEKAAHDLGLAVGETIVVRHPRRTGAAGFEIVESRLPVAGLHANPLRFLAFLDLGRADLMGLAGASNVVYAEPAAGRTVAEVQRALFAEPGVVSVQPVGATARVFRELVEQFLGLLGIAQLAVVALAVLIAFNSASINADERAREYATIFAFGVPVRTVLRMAMVESVVIGLVGTALGLLAGRGVLQWLVDVLLPKTIPDITVTVALSGDTFAKALALGVVAVGLAPLLTARRLMRMDLPSTLRVVE